jgi:integrase
VGQAATIEGVFLKTGKMTALKVRSLTAPGRFGDGGGLWLQVRDADHRSWLFRYTSVGRQRQMGLGPVEDVSLAQARLAAAECRRLLLQGLDPIDQRVEARAAEKAAARQTTFAEAACAFMAAHETSWRSPKHRAQWQATLEQHVFPRIGKRTIAKVDTGDVMGVLEPIWRDLPETAARIRGRIEATLDYAKSRGWRQGENPARWRGHIANMLPKRDRARTVQHHPALPYREIGGFMERLHAQASTAALALQFTILTAARTNETIGATWAEIDFEAAVWTVPGARMKAGREHRVPLSAAVVALLESAKQLRTDSAPAAYVFTGRAEKPMSNMAMSMLLRRMERPDLTTHGFRSTFRDWAAEATDVAREVAEAALAHSLESRVEAAYRRSDLFDKRRQLMNNWAAFCCRDTIAGAADG